MNLKVNKKKLFHQDFSNMINSMKIKNSFLVCFLIFGFFSFSQKVQLKKADASYDQFHYVNAIKTYEKVANKGYKSVELFSKLGDSYYFQSNLNEANKWYEQLFSLNEKVDTEYYFRYAQTLKSIGDYKKADTMMAQFNRFNKADLRAILSNNQTNYLEEIKKNSGRYRIENAGINSEYSDYGTSFYKNTLVFTSARDTGGVFVKKHKWTNQSYTNLYGAIISDNGNLETPVKFSKKIDSKYHESTPVFTNDGLTMYFTRNNFLNGKKGRDSNKTILLKLYKATKIGDSWENIVELPFNSNEYNCAHPALSPDEKTLYFSSNMPGTKGQSDIYKVAILSDGTFGTPVNLGGSINTEARETFPYISNANELYFSSDGHPGLGGLDVFITQIKEDGTHGKIKNVGTPVNSNSDDFAFIMDTATKNGFFSSNRKEDNLGYDDIYKCTETIPVPKDCQQSLTGLLVDEETKLPISGAKVVLYDINYVKIDELMTDQNGKFDFGQVACETKFRLQFDKNEFAAKESFVITPKDSGITDVLIELTPNLQPLKVGRDLRKTLGIDIIYFDLDKSNIRPDAAVELAKILEVMKEYPTLEIDVRSHTDSRQTSKYNVSLSERRAKSTIKWLVENGVAPNRLTGKGYGETQLLNSCADDVPCSEEEHQANRRSEFIITKL
jgi:outer membrane protein OmpA-like peptidoglycan-associated protein/tetratricopeptide (TPR) repeat protein